MTRPLGFLRVDTFDGEAVGLTVPRGAAMGLFQVEGTGFRWRDDGTDPTADLGMLCDGELRYDGDLSAFRMIALDEDTGVNVSMYGPANVFQRYGLPTDA